MAVPRLPEIGIPLLLLVVAFHVSGGRDPDPGPGVRPPADTRAVADTVDDDTAGGRHGQLPDSLHVPHDRHVELRNRDHFTEVFRTALEDALKTEIAALLKQDTLRSAYGGDAEVPSEASAEIVAFVRIDTAGRVARIHVAERKTDTLLDELAADVLENVARTAIAEMRYEPARRGAGPVAVWDRLSIDVTLPIPRTLAERYLGG